MRNSTLLGDSFKWLEVPKGSLRGTPALGIMDEADGLHTSVVTLYEVSCRVPQIRDEATAHDLISGILSHAHAHPVYREISLASRTSQSGSWLLGNRCTLPCNSQYSWPSDAYRKPPLQGERRGDSHLMVRVNAA